ncbi:MAG: monoamine oxidase, partial [Actinomycetota bacterium]|nr:monoamine oxidase [Actinomycetota bacterium]
MSFGSEHQGRGNVGRRSFLKALGLFAAVPALGRRLTARAAPAGAAGQAVSLPAVPTARLAGQAPVLDPARWEACLSAARAMLLVGSGGEDLKLQYLKVLIDDGLPKTRRPRDVLIVGAGIAGLTAGLLLKQAGHHVTIIEANGNRIGGRIKTFHSDPEHNVTPFADTAQYAEAGAMRIPDLHPLTLALIDK